SRPARARCATPRTPSSGRARCSCNLLALERMRRRYDESSRSPFPLSYVSNGEWCPLPPTERQRAAARLLGEEADWRARRLGMARRDFLRTAAGTATAFMVLNTVHGLDQWGDAAVLPVRREHCDDLGAGHERLKARYFVMDVQK